VDTTPCINQHIKTYNINKFWAQHSQFSKLRFADTSSEKPIDLMIGNDYLFDIIKFDDKIEIQPSLHLINSVFGWLLVGRRARDKESVSSILLSTLDALAQLLQLEVMGIRDLPITEIDQEEMALKQFYKTLTF
jgi:hypothetical protein